MERDPRRTSFTAADHAHYERFHAKNQDPQPSHNTADIDTIHVPRKYPPVPNHAVLDHLATGARTRTPHTTIDPNAPNLANPNIQPDRSYRLLSFVTAPKVPHIANVSGPTNHLQAPRFDTALHDIVTYTNVAVAPHYESSRFQAAARTLHSMGIAPSSTSLGIANSGMGAVLTAMGAITPQNASAQHFMGSSFPTTAISAPQTTAIPANSPTLDQFNASMGSAPPSIATHRYSVASYPTAPDGRPFRETGHRSSELIQGVQGHDVAVGISSPNLGDPRDARVRSHPTQAFDQERRLQEQLRLQDMRQINQLHENQRAYQFATENQGRTAVRAQYHISPRFVGPPQSSFSQDKQATSATLNGYDKMARGPADPLGDKGSCSQDGLAPGMKAEAITNSGNLSGFKYESVPATPNTAATSSTLPLTTAPSSPENNVSSSNGSRTKDYACQHPGCTKTFERRYNLTVHFRRHTDEMPYPCKVEGCPQRFKWRSSQSHHMKTRHRDVVLARSGKTANVKTSTRNTTSRNVSIAPRTGGGSGFRYKRTHGVKNEGYLQGSSAPQEEVGRTQGSTHQLVNSISPRKRARTINHDP